MGNGFLLIANDMPYDGDEIRVSILNGELSENLTTGAGGIYITNEYSTVTTQI